MSSSQNITQPSHQGDQESLVTTDQVAFGTTSIPPQPSLQIQVDLRKHPSGIVPTLQ